MNVKLIWFITTVLAVAGCASPAANTPYPDPLQISQLLPADAILLGEQHDAPDHQRIHRFVVETLARQQTLAALALEMAPQGQSTEKLDAQADEDTVRKALQWSNKTWSWDTYGPVVMAAVRAGVPVFGANLPPARLRETMADAGFDLLLPGPALALQQQRIRVGHCDLLPESQVAPMTRIQIARDMAMAQTVRQAARTGKTVVLLAGGSHVDRRLGIPQHLPLEFNAKAVLLHGGNIPVTEQNTSEFDQFWATRPAPPSDHCADFKAHQAKSMAAFQTPKTP